MKQEAVNAIRDAQYELRSAAQKLRLALAHETEGQVVDALYHTRRAVESTQVLMQRLEEGDGE
jgi:hypothetical protein